MLDALLRDTLAGDLGAWRRLQSALEPRIHELARRELLCRARELARSPDDIRDVTVATLERLWRGDFRNLRLYQSQKAQQAGDAQDPSLHDLTFERWIKRATEYAALDHLRKRFGRSAERRGKASGELRAARRELLLCCDPDALEGAQSARVGAAGVPIAEILLVRQIWAHIKLHFPPNEVAALHLHFNEDYELDELAHMLGLPDARAASLLIRKLVARLRYRFARSPRLERARPEHRALCIHGYAKPRCSRALASCAPSASTPARQSATAGEPPTPAASLTNGSICADQLESFVSTAVAANGPATSFSTCMP